MEELARSCGLETSGIACRPDELREAYTRLFINSPEGVPAPPYASFYVAGQGLLMQEGHDHARDFYLRAGLEPVNDNEPADFLPVELFFVSVLLDKGDYSLLAEFAGRHLWAWFQLFEQRLHAAVPHPYYGLMAKLTLFYLRKLNEEVLNEAT